MWKNIELDQISCQNHTEFFKKDYNGFSSVFTENKKQRLDEID